MVEIADEYGQIVYRKTVDFFDNIINIKMDRRLSNGMYMVHCTINGGKFTGKMIVNR